MVIALVTFIVILALAALIRWGRSRNTRLGAIAIAAAALIWAVYRATVLQDVYWLIFRHLGAGWITLFVVLLAGVVVLVGLRFVALATAIAWVSLVLAVLLPFTDIFTGAFWSGWVNSPFGDKLILIGLIILAIVFVRWFGWLVAGILIGLVMLMSIVWGLGIVAGGISSIFEPRAPSPSAASSARPSTNPTPTPTSTTPAPTPSQSSTTTVPSGALVTTKSIVNWQQLKTAASAEFEGVVNDSKPNQGTLGRAKTWSSPVGDTRLVVVFASKAEISDKKARQLVGVGNKTLVTRASDCYTPYEQSVICPSGDYRVLLTLAATVKDGKGYGGVNTWGVAAVKVSGNKFAYWPIAYDDR